MLVSVEVIVEVVLKVSVETGSVVVELIVTVVETVEVLGAGVTVVDGVEVVVLKAYQGIVKTLDVVFTGEVDLGPCFVRQVTNDLVLTCAEAPPRSSSAGRMELTSILPQCARRF